MVALKKSLALRFFADAYSGCQVSFTVNTACRSTRFRHHASRPHTPRHAFTCHRRRRSLRFNQSTIHVGTGKSSLVELMR